MHGHVCSKSLQLCLTLQPRELQSARVLYPWDFPGKNTGVGGHALLQGIFPTQGSNPHLLGPLHWQAGFFTTYTTWESHTWLYIYIYNQCSIKEASTDFFNYICAVNYSESSSHGVTLLTEDSQSPLGTSKHPTTELTPRTCIISHILSF